MVQAYGFNWIVSEEVEVMRVRTRGHGAPFKTSSLSISIELAHCVLLAFCPKIVTDLAKYLHLKIYRRGRVTEREEGERVEERKRESSIC